MLLFVVRFCIVNRTLSELVLLNAHCFVTKNYADLLRATLTNVALLVVLARLVAACTLGMLASLLALGYVTTCRLLLCHLSGLLGITGRTPPSGTQILP